jgi:hypothetical protein
LREENAEVVSSNMQLPYNLYNHLHQFIFCSKPTQCGPKFFLLVHRKLVYPCHFLLK